jgi:hypothetical protein
MKTIITVLLFVQCLAVSKVYSQELTATQEISKSNPQFITTPVSQAKSDLFFSSSSKKNRYRDAVRFRNAGIILSAVGVATIVVGAIMVSNADGVTHYSSTNDGYGTQTDGSFSGAMGAFGIVGGALGVVGGATMWVIGDHAIARERERKTTLYLTPTSARLVCNF